jgi:hypothetical protein
MRGLNSSSNTIQKDRQAQTLVAVLSSPGINAGAFLRRTFQVNEDHGLADRRTLADLNEAAVSEAPSQSAFELELSRAGAPDTALGLLGIYPSSVSALAVRHEPGPNLHMRPKRIHARPFLFRPQRLHGIDGGGAAGGQKRRHQAAHHQQH